MTYPVYLRLDEARLLLPSLTKILSSLQTVQKHLELLSGIEVENEGEDIGLDVVISDMNAQYYRKLYLFHRYVGLLLAKGAVLKDIELGLVDFYSQHEGRDILLCWKIGERDILHWHELEEGFVGRKCVSLLERKREVV